MLVAEKRINENVSELHLMAFLLIHGNKLNASTKRKEFSAIVREAKKIFDSPDSVDCNSNRHAITLAFFMNASNELRKIVESIKPNSRISDKVVEKILNILESF